MCKVSVIVPVYNAEKYLNRCADSILNQNFTDLELILVDDGSSDNSGMICDEYAKKDKRVKVIHKENGGASDARNTGLDVSSGEYITFCDSDDLILSGGIECMVNAAKEENSDLVIGGFKEVNINKLYNLEITTIQLIRGNFTVYEDKIKDEFAGLWYENNMTSSWAKLYKSSIVKGNNIYFNKELVVLEDFCFVLNYCKEAKKITSIENIVYEWKIFSDNPSHLRRSRLDYVDDVMYAYNLLCDYLNQKSIPEDPVFWNKFSAQFKAAYESLWTIKYENLKERIQKYRRIHEVLLKKPYKRLNRDNKKNHLLLRHWSLMHGNIIGLLFCNKMGW